MKDIQCNKGLHLSVKNHLYKKPAHKLCYTSVDSSSIVETLGYGQRDLMLNRLFPKSGKDSVVDETPFTSVAP